jgi:hypothetical protein
MAFARALGRGPREGASALLSARYHLRCMMRAVHMRLTMQRFTLLLASALVVVFGAAVCGVGHTAYVGFASRSMDTCLVLPGLSDLVAT